MPSFLSVDPSVTCPDAGKAAHFAAFCADAVAIGKTASPAIRETAAHPKGFSSIVILLSRPVSQRLMRILLMTIPYLGLQLTPRLNAMSSAPRLVRSHA